MAIDTLKVARRLREAGFSEPQAEALVDAVREGADEFAFVSKSDLSLELTALRSEMREMEQRIIAEVVSRMFAMIVGTVLVNIVAMLGAMFAFAKLLGH